jgi:hypothetical protein
MLSGMNISRINTSDEDSSYDDDEETILTIAEQILAEED